MKDKLKHEHGLTSSTTGAKIPVIANSANPDEIAQNKQIQMYTQCNENN